MQDLSMQHLRQGPEDAKRALAEARAPAPPPVAPTDDPMRQIEYTWEFSYTDGVGKQHKGSFTNRILNIAQKIQIGVVRAKRLGGASLLSVAPRTAELLFIVGWLEESLVNRPAWAKELLDLSDEVLVEQLYIVAMRHEQTFFGRGGPDPAGQEEPPGGTEPA